MPEFNDSHALHAFILQPNTARARPASTRQDTATVTIFRLHDVTHTTKKLAHITHTCTDTRNTHSPPTHTHTPHTHTRAVTSVTLGLVSAILMHVYVEKRRCCDCSCSNQTPFERPHHHPSFWSDRGYKSPNQPLLEGARSGRSPGQSTAKSLGAHRSQTSASVDNNLLCGR